MRLIVLALIVLLGAACAPSQAVFVATMPPTATVPEFTVTPTFSPVPTRTLSPTPIPTDTLTPSRTPIPTNTHTPTATRTSSPVPTQPLVTLTPVTRSADQPAAFSGATPEISATDGWTCGDFPCSDDIDGFTERIRVPEGYALDFVGQFPGQVQQIAYGNDGRLYATVLENGSRSGAVYALNADGNAERYSGTLISPLGLAFQPGTDDLYVSARETPLQGGGVWRVPAGGGDPIPVIADLPCCYSLIDNQPAGMVFGPDGLLYLGVGALSDHGETGQPATSVTDANASREAAVLQINPHSGDVAVYAAGIRFPFDVTFDSTGRFYATDSGTVAGVGDRLLALDDGGFYGFPFWRNRGCAECPLSTGNLRLSPDLLIFPSFTLPRGLVAYTGSQFPANQFDMLFVALWNNVESGQRIVRIDPAQASQEGYVPEPFVTGLIRPVDVTLDPEGALVIADYVYGHVWRVRFVGSSP